MVGLGLINRIQESKVFHFLVLLGPECIKTGCQCVEGDKVTPLSLPVCPVAGCSRGGASTPPTGLLEYEIRYHNYKSPINTSQVL